MRSGVNVTRHPNQKIPDDFLVKLFETHTTALGYAVVTDGEVESGSFLSDTLKDQPGFEGQDTFDLMTAYETIETEHPDKKVFYWLYQADPSEFSMDSMQPYTILADEDKVILSVILEGEFGKDYHKDTTDTQEYNVVADYLSSKIEAIYKQTGGNMEKTLQVLDSPQVRSDMLKIMQPRGEIFVIPAKGKPLAFSENKLRAEYPPWGYASKTLGYTEPGMKVVNPPKASVPAVATATPAPVSTRPLTMSEKKARDNALKGSTAPAVMPENTPQPDVVEPKPGAEPITTTPNGQPVDHPNLVMRDTVLHARPEKGIPLAAAKAFWSRNYNGKKPEDEKAIWAGFPATQLKHDSPIKEFLKTSKKVDTAMSDAMKKAADQKKPLTADAAVDKQKGPIQILTVEDRQKARALIEADREANKTKTFAEILESEKEFRPYTEQTGTSLNDACRLSIKTLYEMGNRSLANLCKEVIGKLVEIDPAYGEPPAEKKIEEPAPAVASSKKPSVKERLEAARQAKVA